MRRTSPAWRGSKTKPRTFYVHEERRAVHSIGEIRIVFSTKQKPKPGEQLLRNQTKVLLTNAQHLSVAEIVEWYLLRWQIELFFKELKSSLGMHQYRFRRFQSVEAWVEACFITFLYLEWIRLQRLRKTKVEPPEKRWWSRQRTYGLALAVSQRLAETQVRVIHRYTATEWGIKKLRRLLRNALPTEYRNAA
jgi:IS4 transposase